MKKPKVNRADLQSRDEIWNVVTSVLIDYGYACDQPLVNEAFTVSQYYSEMESGGHESFIRWNSEQIEAIGICRYLEILIGGLEKIGAQEYARIEQKYGEEMWKLYIALENNEIDETNFYHIIKKADGEYYSLNDKLRGLLEDYFVLIHTDLIEIVD